MTGHFQPFLDEHDDFLEMLLQHQEALVRHDVETASERIARLDADLQAHIRHEEEKLLPALEAAGGWTRIGHPQFYRDEHAKILRWTSELLAATDALDADSPEFHRSVALLIGREQGFRSLLEHHDDRERKALFPDLERVTTPAEQALLLEPPD